jgi:hypothetical protein
MRGFFSKLHRPVERFCVKQCFTKKSDQCPAWVWWFAWRIEWFLRRMTKP